MNDDIKKIQIFKYLRKLCNEDLKSFATHIYSLSHKEQNFSQDKWNEINLVHSLLYEIKCFDDNQINNTYSKFIKLNC